MEDLKGICAIVSSGSTSLGAGIIRELATRGASILALDPSEEKLEDAIAALQLENADEIFTHELEGGDIVSWWDLANLVGSYFNTLNFFVHIADPGDPVEARALGVDALRGAQVANSESFVNAMGRLQKYLIEASQENDEGARVIAVTSGASQSDAAADVLGSATHATSAALADALSQDFAKAALNIRVHAFRPSATDSTESAATKIVGFLDEK